VKIEPEIICTLYYKFMYMYTYFKFDMGTSQQEGEVLPSLAARSRMQICDFYSIKVKGLVYTRPPD